MCLHNYVLYGGMVLSTGLGVALIVEYISNPRDFANRIKEKSLDVVFWYIRQYVSLKESYHTYIHPAIHSIQIASNETYLCINKDTYDIHVYDNLQMIPDTNLYRIFEKISLEDTNKIVYKQLHFQDDATTILCKPYIYVTFKQNSVSIDITPHLKNFFVVGNVLDNTFFVFFMKHYYAIDICSTNYLIQYMDSNIQQGDLNRNSVIILTKDENNTQSDTTETDTMVL